MNLKTIDLVINGKKFALVAKWTPELERYLYHNFKLNATDEIAEVLCNAIKECITPQLIADALKEVDATV